MISKEEEKKDVENKKSEQLNDDKIASSLCLFLISTHNISSLELLKNVLTCVRSVICLKSLSME